MTLIAILLSLGVERYLGGLQSYRSFGWLARLAVWMRGRGEYFVGPVVLAIVVLAVVLPVAVLQIVLHGSLLLSLVLSVAVLVFSYGPKTFYDRIKEFTVALESGNVEAACWYASGTLGRKTSGAATALARAVAEGLLVITSERLLAVVFWFALLGPAGAALYRVASVLRGEADDGDDGNDFMAAARQLHYVMAWVPARLTSLAFALVGSFQGAYAQRTSREEVLKPHWRDANERLLVAAGAGALGLPEQPPATVSAGIDEVHQALALVRRAITIWVAVLALMTLSGWAA